MKLIFRSSSRSDGSLKGIGELLRTCSLFRYVVLRLTEDRIDWRPFVYEMVYVYVYVCIYFHLHTKYWTFICIYKIVPYIFFSQGVIFPKLKDAMCIFILFWNLLYTCNQKHCQVSIIVCLTSWWSWKHVWGDTCSRTWSSRRVIDTRSRISFAIIIDDYENVCTKHLVIERCFRLLCRRCPVYLSVSIFAESFLSFTRARKDGNGRRTRECTELRTFQCKSISPRASPLLIFPPLSNLLH